MQKLNEIEFHKYLASIAYYWVLNDENQKKYISLGINPDHWIDCEAKSLLREYLFFVKQKGKSFADKMISPKILALDVLEHEFDIDEFRSTYNTNLKRHKAIILGRSLQSNPDAADDILARYTAKQSVLKDMKELPEMMAGAVVDNETKIKNKTNLVILPGFEMLSRAISGFNPQRISMLGAISGFGKTKLAVNLAVAAAKNTRTLYFNMEMGYTDFSAMFIQNMTGITHNEWTSGAYLTGELKNKLINTIKNNDLDLVASDGKNLSIDEIYSMSIHYTNNYDRSFIIIDYDQKILSSEKGEEWQQMLKTIVRLEDLAKITNSHVLVLYQADDEGNIKSSKRAMQPASCVLNFYQEEGNFFIKSTKNRFAQHFILKVDYKPEITLIKELELNVGSNFKPRVSIAPKLR